MAAFTRSCDGCGVSYKAQRRTSRYHSAACGVQARRRAAQTAAIESAASAPAGTAGSVPAELATQAEVRRRLSEADRLETVDGQCALALARSIDRGDEKGAALAALIRSLRETMTLALAGTAAPVKDGIDELQERRAHRRAAR